MAAPLMYERIYAFQLRKIAGQDMEIPCLRLDCILPVELKTVINSPCVVSTPISETLREAHAVAIRHWGIIIAASADFPYS